MNLEEWDNKVRRRDENPFWLDVRSDVTSEWYVVDIIAFDGTGQCNCPDYQIRKEGKVVLGGRGARFRCKHIKLAREWALEFILPKLANAINMEDTEPEKEPAAGYARAKREFLSRWMKCAVFPWKGATDIHHQRGRLSKLLMDQRWWVPVSRDGHRKIHDQPDWARGVFWNGIPLLCARGEWNKQP